jgi:septum formation protein
MPIVLASASPRRHELLARANVAYEVIVSAAEEIHDATLRHDVLCELNAKLKATAVAALRPDATVIGADTLVFLDDVPFGKPKDLAEARAMLQQLCGRAHLVCTGVCVVIPGGEVLTFHETTEVVFRDLDAAAIDAYLALTNPLDKAGAYGIQDHRELLVLEIRGSFENVMGLPIQRLIEVLSENGLR